MNIIKAIAKAEQKKAWIGRRKWQSYVNRVFVEPTNAAECCKLHFVKLTQNLSLKIEQAERWQPKKEDMEATDWEVFKPITEESLEIEPEKQTGPVNRECKTARLNCSIKPSLKLRLQEIARSQGKSLNDVVAAAIEMLIKDVEEDHA